ncbi:PAS domain S-box protein [Cytobacillus suaedae]|nr:PAS domain S-box protein [Cytobacillus suaedae]
MFSQEVKEKIKKNSYNLFLLFIHLTFIILNFYLILKEDTLSNLNYIFLLSYLLILFTSLYLSFSYYRSKREIKRRIESEERYKQLIDNHPDGIVIHEKGVILYVNPIALSYTGYEEHEVIGRSLLEFAHASQHEKIKLREQKIYTSPEEISLDLSEYELISKDGTSTFVESKAIVCQFNNKRCVQLVLRNINDRRKQEELLKASEKLAVVGQIAAGIAHEIRNPLTSIKGFIQMMGEDSKNEHYYDVLMSEIDRINQVTNDFLILAKPQAQNFKVHPVNHIVSEVILLMQPEALLHDVEFTYLPYDEELQLLCDRNELKQVFINIIKNSIEAMPLGGFITIHTFPIENKVQIEITDSGIGIPKERIVNIGQPFYTLKEKGTGLGLMTTIKIIEKHHGTFQLQSEEGKGTTVTIDFPLIH